MSKDYYQILGVDKKATKDEIKKAFRKKAHEHHPDKGNGNADKFKEINEAYQVLSDKQKRQQYYQYGSTGPFGYDGARANSGQGGMGGFNWQDMAGGQGAQGNINMDDLGDIFGGLGDIFGFGGRSNSRRGPQRGHDMESELTITFEESYSGVEKMIQLKKNIQCNHCHGNGAEPGAKIETCQTCKGSGQVRQVQNTMFGQMSSVIVCPDCHGEGKSYSQKCKDCRGSGVINDYDKIKVKVPAGISNGQSLKLSGKGEAGIKGGPVGDLYLNIFVKPSAKFKRDGHDLYTARTITLTQALLGDKVNVDIMEGKVKLKIPSGTESGKRFLIRGKGMPKLQGSGYGNLYVEVDIDIPSRLNRQQKKLIEELKKEGL